ncbi:hypothetical protein PIB30_019943 [Stylosanthes scabra]|uniref:Membrane-associated kinase regulator 6 n=1 Tax=Stylosanthes scabra TaxID=79078 RepID=A0ABU6W6F9_9FABA|nr:hypothetical protein [Stylosanthes scabra]
MEASLAIASESFSYSWLSSNCKNKSPLDHLLTECKNFNFDPSITHSPVVLVHADELFANGILRPAGEVVEPHYDSRENQRFFDSNRVLDSSRNGPDSTTQTKLGPSSPGKLGTNHGILAKWRRSTWRTLVYLFRYVNKQFGSSSSSRISTRVDDIDKTDLKFGSLRSSSVQASPIVDLHHHHENSIFEAVLHCKRSVGSLKPVT